MRRWLETGWLGARYAIIRGVQTNKIKQVYVILQFSWLPMYVIQLYAYRTDKNGRNYKNYRSFRKPCFLFMFDWHCNRNMISEGSTRILIKYIPSFKKGCDFGVISSFCRSTHNISINFCFNGISRRWSQLAAKVEKFGLSIRRCKKDATKRSLIWNFREHSKIVFTNSYFGGFRIIVRVQTVMTELYCYFSLCLQAIRAVQF
jgi:hypothetical protein